MKLYIANVKQLKTKVLLEGYCYRKNPTPKNEYDRCFPIYHKEFVKLENWNDFAKTTKGFPLVANIQYIKGIGAQIAVK